MNLFVAYPTHQKLTSMLFYAWRRRGATPPPHTHPGSHVLCLSVRADVPYHCDRLKFFFRFVKTKTTKQMITILVSSLLAVSADPVCDATRQMFQDTGCCGASGDVSVCVSPHVDLEMPGYAQGLLHTFSADEKAAVQRLRGTSLVTSYPFYDKDVYVGPSRDALSIAGTVVSQALILQHVTQSRVTLRTDLGFSENPFSMSASDFVLSWGTSDSRDAASASTMLNLRQNLRDFQVVSRAELENEVLARLQNGTLGSSSLRPAVCKSGTTEFVQADWYVGIGGSRDDVVFVDCSNDEFTPLYQAVADGQADFTHLATFYPDSSFTSISDTLVRVSYSLYTASKGVYINTASSHHDDLVTVWTAILRTGIVDAYFQADNALASDGQNYDNVSPVSPLPTSILITDRIVTPLNVLYKGRTITPEPYVLSGNVVWYH